MQSPLWAQWGRLDTLSLQQQQAPVEDIHHSNSPLTTIHLALRHFLLKLQKTFLSLVAILNQNKNEENPRISYEGHNALMKFSCGLNVADLWVKTVWGCNMVVAQNNPVKL